MKERPKALICGMLEEDGKVLFLKREGGIELPSVFGSLGADPLSQMTEAFKKQSGIKAECGDVVIESRYELEAGLRIPCLVFSMKRLREGEPEPATVYSGFEWLTMDEARKRKPAPKGTWLKEPMVRIG
ncbi:MAG: hypothetical protein AB1295_04910 [Candidatus Micrarchaeota archaeon]